MVNVIPQHLMIPVCLHHANSVLLSIAMNARSMTKVTGCLGASLTGELQQALNHSVRCCTVYSALVCLLDALVNGPYSAILCLQAGPPRQKQKKRINLRDLSFYLEQERETRKSHLLYKTLSK